MEKIVRIEERRSLKELTTFGIGGPARYFCEAVSVEDLSEALEHCHQNNIPFFILGKGSNTLFDDRGFDGMVILNKIFHMEQKGSVVEVGAGYSFSLLGVQTARKGWSGLEFASGIPGSVGGAIYMNAGASGGETFTTLSTVTFVDVYGEVHIYPKESLKWGYRFSSFQNMKGAIAAARFELSPSEEARKKQLSIVDYRTKTQPYGAMSAGCVFRNPVPQSAGALIEKCGLKGFRIGGAEVSTLHANFLINSGGASAADILALAHHVKEVVKEKTGADLEMEVRVIPYSSP
ncbi:MAG: UDP-N-acetylmuramate dehydrogenase [Verrucomicrobia bacterium]|nr:UDP-N-acetylmuramate dehydrogenase [Verrucomicrobiota bacterium]